MTSSANCWKHHKMFTWWHQWSLCMSADSCTKTSRDCPFKVLKMMTKVSWNSATYFGLVFQPSPPAAAPSKPAPAAKKAVSSDSSSDSDSEDEKPVKVIHYFRVIMGAQQAPPPLIWINLQYSCLAESHPDQYRYWWAPTSSYLKILHTPLVFYSKVSKE